MSIKRIDAGARMSGAVVHGNTVYVAGQVGEGETAARFRVDSPADVAHVLEDLAELREHLGRA